MAVCLKLMTLVVYSLVSQAGNVIADYTSPITYTGASSDFHVNLDSLARTQLARIPKQNYTGTSVILGHYFHHCITGDLTLLCVTNCNDDPHLPRRFLNELKTSCKPSVINNTTERSELLTRILSRLVTDYNETSDKLKSIESSLQETTHSLRGSIASILERGELIDSIVSKTSNLKEETAAFSKAVRNANSGILRKLAIALADSVTSTEFFIGISITTIIGVLYFFVVA